MMLDSTLTRNPWRPAGARDCDQARLADATNKLRKHHAEPLFVCGREAASPATAGGVPLRVSVSGLVQSTVPKDSLVMRLAMLLEQGIPVTLALSNLGVAGDALKNFELFCECLARRLPEPQLADRLIGLSIRSRRIPLGSYLEISTALLGNGPRYVSLDPLTMTRQRDAELQREIDSDWDYLLQRSQSPRPLMPVYGKAVHAPCALLPDEPAGSVLPTFGLRVPADTAWLPLTISLKDFSDGRGALMSDALQDAAHACIDHCEEILDALCWPLPRHDWDAVNNRRLAIFLTGLGDFVVERDADPRDWRTLQWLDRIVREFRAALWRRSHELALRGGVLPAIQLDDPSTGWTSDEHRSSWRTRWTSALREHAVRHRNILVLSPYSLLPSTRGKVPGFADLLPVLSHADAISFASPPEFSGWNVSEFSNFHRRAWVASGATKA